MPITSNNQVTQTCAYNPLLPRQVLKDIMLFYKPGFERVPRRPIGLILLRCGVFPGEDHSRSCKWMRWCGGCLGKGWSDNMEM
jgi:hypothetical protein